MNRSNSGRSCRLILASAALATLLSPWSALGAGPDAPVWVYFTDKGIADAASERAAIDDLANTYNPRAIARRQHRRTDPGLFDARDLPVAPAYVNAVSGTGASVRIASRWLNAVSVNATPEQVAALRALGCVSKVETVRRAAPRDATLEAPVRVDAGFAGRGFYGYADAQLAQINLINLHAAGFTGQGVVVGILDTGFRRDHNAFNEPGHTVNVVAEHDFINNDGNTGIEAGDPSDQHSHGTLILSVIGAYRPGELVGGAYDASFILCKTEVVPSETPVEEDYYAAGLEFIESNGGDMATSSLGYIDWYTQADLDGQTAVTTIAVNTATANGVFCCTAAGNEYHDANPATSHLIAPADALKVITCGAADSAGNIADFSSDGPTADGRQKPEVLARGVGTSCVWPYDTVNYASASGTSLSTPVVASAVACLIGARPGWTVDRMRNYLFWTAGDYIANGQPDAEFVRGYGVIDAKAAYDLGCPSDYNGDSFVNGIDFDEFVDVFIAGSPAADFDGNTFVNGDDFDGFTAAFVAGC